MDGTSERRQDNLIPAPQILGFLAGLLMALCYFVPMYELPARHAQTDVLTLPPLMAQQDLLVALATVAIVLAVILEKPGLFGYLGFACLVIWCADRFVLTTHGQIWLSGNGALLFLGAAVTLLIAGRLSPRTAAKRQG